MSKATEMPCAADVAHTLGHRDVRELHALRSALDHCTTVEQVRSEVATAMGYRDEPTVPSVPGSAAKLDDYQLVMALICNVTCEQHHHVVRVEVIPEIERRLAARNVAMQCPRCNVAMRPCDTVTVGSAAPGSGSARLQIAIANLCQAANDVARQMQTKLQHGRATSAEVAMAKAAAEWREACASPFTPAAPKCPYHDGNEDQMCTCPIGGPVPCVVTDHE